MLYPQFMKQEETIIKRVQKIFPHFEISEILKNFDDTDNKRFKNGGPYDYCAEIEETLEIPFDDFCKGIK